MVQAAFIFIKYDSILSMGCYYSREGDEEIRKPSVIATSDSDIRVDSVSQYDEYTISIIQRDFWEDLQYFLLNNMLLCVQFFKNYQKDIVKLFHSSTNKKEKALNRILLQHETVECTCPDIVMDNINENIRYRRSHGPKKNIPDTLAPKRLFVVYDRIEVVNSVEIPEYTSIDKPAYQVIVENSKKKGFVRLKYLDAKKPPKTYAVPSDKPPSEPVPSTSKEPDQEIYEYNTIYELKTPKPLEVSPMSERRDTLPETCFTSSKVAISQVQFAEMMMQNECNDIEFRKEDYFDTVIHIDAKGFMDYFKNGLFPNSLGRSLGFNELEISNANAAQGKIFCNLTDEEDNPLPCEVIPSVSIPWPEDLTYEFVNREDRPTITDRRTGYVYRWPTDDMLKEIKTMNCVVVPNGYLQKRGQAPDANIEWEIAFPKAERYLEARMSHPQIKCYMFLLALLKTYIDPVTHQHGLLPEHIRCHMYWECETDYRNWPEHRLGYKIMEVIRNLNKRLSIGELPDYFIRSRNLFRNIPQKYLQVAQKQFHVIMQSPVMYFLEALRNCRYTNGRFYTPFNFKELYKILTQPQGPKKVLRRFHSTANQGLKPRTYNDRDMQIKHETELIVRAQILQKIKEKEEEEKQRNRRESVDSVDLGWVCKSDLEKWDSRAILMHFIQMYIKIAEDSIRLTAHSQAQFYLKIAFYLSTILERISPIFREDASDFKTTIHQLELASKKRPAREVTEMPPMTPVRNSGQFDFPMAQQLRNSAGEQENLANSISGNEVKVKFAPNAAAMKTQKGVVQRIKSMESGPRKSVSFIESK